MIIQVTISSRVSKMLRILLYMVQDEEIELIDSPAHFTAILESLMLCMSGSYSWMLTSHTGLIVTHNSEYAEHYGLVIKILTNPYSVLSGLVL